MCNAPDWLPALVRLSDYDGDWNRYIEEVFAVFHRDFVQRQARFRGRPVRVGTQLIDGKERTFWHVTSEGSVEVDREPCLRRCERIGWLRAFIDHDGDPAILSWPQRRGRRRRHILWLMEREFAVVLEERPRCWWLWTAYPTDRRHTQEKLMREYESWKNADAAP